MTIEEAILKRINDICKEKKITINTLGNLSGVNPSTIYSMFILQSKNPKIHTIKKICDGLDISVKEFFSADIFDDLEQEIK